MPPMRYRINNSRFVVCCHCVQYVHNEAAELPKHLKHHPACAAAYPAYRPGTRGTTPYPQFRTVPVSVAVDFHPKADNAAANAAVQVLVNSTRFNGGDDPNQQIPEATDAEIVALYNRRRVLDPATTPATPNQYVGVVPAQMPFAARAYGALPVVAAAAAIAPLPIAPAPAAPAPATFAINPANWASFQQISANVLQGIQGATNALNAAVAAVNNGGVAAEEEDEEEDEEDEEDESENEDEDVEMEG